jgi:hypothetical protein
VKRFAFMRGADAVDEWDLDIATALDGTREEAYGRADCELATAG